MKRMLAITLLFVGLGSIAMADSLNVRQVGVYDTPGFAQAVAVSGNFAYVADGDSGLRIINISNPASPTQTGFYDTPGSAYAVAVSGNYAYVADGDSGLRIINISNPASPFETGHYPTLWGATSLAVSGSFAYVTAIGDGLRIIDVSNPANPIETGHYITSRYANGVALYGNTYAYVVGANYGLWVLNIGNPYAPFPVDSFDTPMFANGVASSGMFIYVADAGSGLWILHLVGGLHVEGHYDSTSSYWSVAVSGNYAYLGDYNYGLQVIDISNPASPARAGYYGNPAGNARGVAVSGSHAYLADGSFGLRILQFPIPPMMGLNSGQHDFGAVTAGDSLSWNGLYVRNTGGLPFSVDSLKFATGAFRADAPTDSTVAPGDSLRVTFWFKPGASGQFTDTVTVYAGEAENSPQKAGLTGTGTPALVVIDVPSGTVPRFTGTIDPHEWADAHLDTFRIIHKSKVFIPDSFWVKYNRDTLYLVLKTPSYTAADVAAHHLLIDTLMKRTDRLDQDDIRLSVWFDGESVEWYGNENWALTPVSRWRSAFSASTDLITEFVVPLNKIGITPETFDSVGFSVFANGADHFGRWPSSADSTQPLTWGILTSTGAWTGVAGQPEVRPPIASFALANAYPNPASTQVSLNYQLPAPSTVRLSVYNITGQLVRRFDRGRQPAGSYSVRCGTEALPNGLYFYRLDAGPYTATRRLLVIR